MAPPIPVSPSPRCHHPYSVPISCPRDLITVSPSPQCPPLPSLCSSPSNVPIPMSSSPQCPYLHPMSPSPCSHPGSVPIPVSPSPQVVEQVGVPAALNLYPHLMLFLKCFLLIDVISPLFPLHKQTGGSEDAINAEADAVRPHRGTHRCLLR